MVDLRLYRMGIEKLRTCEDTSKAAVSCRWHPKSGNALLLAPVGKLQITSTGEVIDIIERETMPAIIDVQSEADADLAQVV